MLHTCRTKGVPPPPCKRGGTIPRRGSIQGLPLRSPLCCRCAPPCSSSALHLQHPRLKQRLYHCLGAAAGRRIGLGQLANRDRLRCIRRVAACSQQNVQQLGALRGEKEEKRKGRMERRKPAEESCSGSIHWAQCWRTGGQRSVPTAGTQNNAWSVLRKESKQACQIHLHR